MTKKEQIIQTFRDDIASGALKPGTRLPIRGQIVERFNSSLMTVQKAMEQLISEGWLAAHGCHGTYVADTPPNQNRYGMFFPFKSTESRPWRRFWTVAHRVAEEVLTQKPSSLSIFYGLDVGASLDQYRAFHETIQAQRLAGMFFISWPIPQFTTILERKPALPCAVFASHPVKGGITLTIDTNRFFDQACKVFAGSQRQRVGALLPDTFFAGGFLENTWQNISQYGLTSELGWIQAYTNFRMQEAVDAQIAAMFGGTGGAPDCLYLGDDNYIEPVARALAKIGKSVPEDVLIACWGATPWPEEYSIPFQRIGVDLKPLIIGAKAEIDRIRRGEDAEMVIDNSTVEVFA